MQQTECSDSPHFIFMGQITQGGPLDFMLIATGLVYEARDEVRRYLRWTKTKPYFCKWERIVLP
jgi:hypothetical protein